MQKSLSFFSGMLMYELHMPLIMITQMQLQSGLLSKDQVEIKGSLNLLLKEGGWGKGWAAFYKCFFEDIFDLEAVASKKRTYPGGRFFGFRGVPLEVIIDLLIYALLPTLQTQLYMSLSRMTSSNLRHLFFSWCIPGRTGGPPHVTTLKNVPKIPQCYSSHMFFILAQNTILCSHKGLFTLELVSLFFGALFSGVDTNIIIATKGVRKLGNFWGVTREALFQKTYKRSQNPEYRYTNFRIQGEGQIQQNFILQ